MRGITIDSKHSYTDYGLIVKSTEYGSIKKKLVRATVPYSDVVYDFSELNNTENYEEQELKYTFEFTEFDLETMETNTQAVIAWLLGANNGTLIYDDISDGFHYVGKCVEVSQNRETYITRITATFLVNHVKAVDA